MFRAGSWRKVSLPERQLETEMFLRMGRQYTLPGPFRAAGNLPFMKATLLEALARGYESAQQSDKAFQIWNELYLLSIGTGFKLAEAEATFKMAEIYKSQKNVPDALKYYGVVNSDFAKPSRQPAPFSSSHLPGLISNPRGERESKQFHSKRKSQI